jgi:hypothetical protein
VLRDDANNIKLDNLGQLVVKRVNCLLTLQPRSWRNVTDLLTYRPTSHTQTVAKISSGRYLD